MDYLNKIILNNLEATKINAKLALSNRLFVSGWSLNEYLHLSINDNCPKANYIYYVDIDSIDNKPVSVILIEKNIKKESCYVQVFTKKSYRNKGIAKSLFNKTILKLGINKENIVWQEGIDGSLVFWDKVTKQSPL